MLANYLAILAGSLVLSLLLTPAVRRLAVNVGFVDQPATRKMHHTPVPLLGGVAVWVAALAALIAFTDRLNLPQLGWILLGGTIVAVGGLVDDRRGLSPYQKLALQALASVALIVGGIRIESLPWLWANIALTVLWVVGITNAMNLLDNMDGLAGVVTAVASGFFLVLSANSGQFLVASLSAAMAGASLGFLRFNLSGKHRIFLGDAGALFIGFMLAALGIKLRFGNNWMVTWLIPVLVLGIPIFDTTLVTISRLRRRLNPLTTPGKDHLSHRLVLSGLTQREAVLIIALIGVVLGLAATFLTSAGLLEAAIIGGSVALGGAYAVWRLEYLYRNPPTATLLVPAATLPQQSRPNA